MQEISNDDVLRAIKKLKVLGNGFTLIPLRSGRYLVQVCYSTIFGYVCCDVVIDEDHKNMSVVQLIRVIFSP